MGNRLGLRVSGVDWVWWTALLVQLLAIPGILLPVLPVGGPLLGALLGPLLGAGLGELLSAPTSLGPLGLLRLRRSLVVGLAVVGGFLPLSR